MKLILRHYLESLRERQELDAILPDLVSKMGLNLLTKPEIGVRQGGVDVAAVGRLKSRRDRVFLFTIKPGNLTRHEWSSGPQALRQSLEEIRDSYIPARIPPQHRRKQVVVCICLGGVVSQAVDQQVTGFLANNTTSRLTFEIWTADDIASHIESCFLREDLLPERARASLRKSIAMLDSPETACSNFTTLLESLSSKRTDKARDTLSASRQICICTWIVFSWCREAGAHETAYRVAELALLRAWTQTHRAATESRAEDDPFARCFQSVFHCYMMATEGYVENCIAPHANSPHALSHAIRGSNHVDVNLKMFDVVGRVGMYAIWTYWIINRSEGGDVQQKLMEQLAVTVGNLVSLLDSNPILRLPLLDEHAVDISIALLPMALFAESRAASAKWLDEILAYADFALHADMPYPTIHGSYVDLLGHPKRGDDDYKKRHTAASVLYPHIALWASLLDLPETYQKARQLQAEHLTHSTFQVWFPDDSFEDSMFTQRVTSGRTLPVGALEESMSGFADRLFAEANVTPEFENLPSVKWGWWPLTIVACRLRRVPIPIQLFRDLRRKAPTPAAPTASTDTDTPIAAPPEPV